MLFKNKLKLYGIQLSPARHWAGRCMGRNSISVCHYADFGSKLCNQCKMEVTISSISSLHFYTLGGSGDTTSIFHTVCRESYNKNSFSSSLFVRRKRLLQYEKAASQQHAPFREMRKPRAMAIGAAPSLPMKYTQLFWEPLLRAAVSFPYLLTSGYDVMVGTPWSTGNGRLHNNPLTATCWFALVSVAENFQDLSEVKKNWMRLKNKKT